MMDAKATVTYLTSRNRHPGLSPIDLGAMSKTSPNIDTSFITRKGLPPIASEISLSGGSLTVALKRPDDQVAQKSGQRAEERVNVELKDDGQRVQEVGNAQ